MKRSGIGAGEGEEARMHLVGQRRAVRAGPGRDIDHERVHPRARNRLGRRFGVLSSLFAPR